MKRLTFLVAALFVTIGAFAQSMQYQDAVTDLSMGNLVSAKANIDKACMDEKTKDLAKVWQLKGDIYRAISYAKSLTASLEVDMTMEKVATLIGPTNDKRLKKHPESKVKMERWVYPYDVALWFDEGKLKSWDEAAEGSLKNLEGDFLGEAFEAYQKATSLDSEKELQYKISFGLQNLQYPFFNEGAALMQDSKFAEAAKKFDRAAFCASVFGQLDSNAVYYAGYSAMKAKDWDLAAKKFRQLANAKHKDASTYINLSKVYIEKKDTIKALKVLQKGKVIMPNKLQILIEEINIFLSMGQSDKAKAALEKAIELDPNNHQLHYAVGTTYDNMGLTEEAAKAYENAVKIKADYFDALFNLGVIYNNESVELRKVRDEIPINDTEGYDKANNAMKEAQKKALPYFEKALAAKPNDMDVLVALKKLYVELRMTDKYKEVNAKIQELKK